MTAFAILGAQWGDEGKGKIVDLLSVNSEYVVRFQGGNNAGHTIYNDGKKIVLHLLPTGIVNIRSIAVLAGGMVIDPIALCDELDSLHKTWNIFKYRLFISERAHILTFYHKLQDNYLENLLNIGTTKRGIGPCYADKANRFGIRFAEFADLASFKKKLSANWLEKNKLLKNNEVNYDEEEDKLISAITRIKSYITNTDKILHEAYERSEKILLEGAQGTFLDLDYGSYPYVTSSNTTIGSAITGSGLNHKQIKRVIGVAKFYLTRVGEGPFLTEIHGAEAENLRTIGNEFGASTGRPRRVGWLDLVQLKRAIEINGIDCLALTKLDVLDSYDKIYACIGYHKNGPQYKEFIGWKKPTSEILTWKKLPKEAKDYILYIEHYCQTKVAIISNGVDTAQTINLIDLF